MRNLYRVAFGCPAVLVLLSLVVFGQGQGGRGGQRGAAPAAAAAPAPPPPNSAPGTAIKDLSGIWGRFGNRNGRRGLQGGNGVRDAGDAGIGGEVPPMTAEGKKLFDANKPSYGRTLGSPEAAAHPEEPIGRRRAVPPAQGNDPGGTCQPIGLTSLILSTYFSPYEFFTAKDRVIQHFEWTNEWREVWTDGRQLVAEPDVPRWNGYSTGRWDGDTFVINSNGFEAASWLDHFGYPHSDEMKIEEKYRRTAPDRLELVMTLTDPKIYTKPWVSEKKVFRLLTKEETTVSGWNSVLEDRCVPSEEFDFNKRVRDPAGGIAK